MEPAQREALRVSAGLAYACGSLDEIRRLLRDTGADPTTPLQQLLIRMRSRDTQAISSALDALHTALQRAGDARGIFGNLRGMTGAGLRPIEIVYRCPETMCTGRRDDEVGSQNPLCAITGCELIKDIKR
ncbi:hypothetical protein [Nocardia sp. XZ_19_385]|uniref:hypothetical protein n=1 Tax=Nocardia sp. XZ_19_385 TaxID=2769488 RepID=UPI00188DD69E|nr:hypothetical protein [Nocardia sp. XZ_19_385]